VRVVVAPVRSVMQPFAVGLGDLPETRLRAGDRVELDDVVRDLADAAYHRVDMVERRGEFAVRGGIVDVFPPTAAHPVRVEFFGDEVEELREFAVADQRSLGTVEELLAPPCRELLLTASVRERAAALLDRYPGAAELLTKVAEGSASRGWRRSSPSSWTG
jgi:transcription-repair coupling factor (superfamily II helicase)